MKRKRFSVEQIIRMGREAEVHISQEKTVTGVSRELGISEETFYCWRKEHGGMKVPPAGRLKEFEKENTRLKRAVADLTLDKLILRAALPMRHASAERPGDIGEMCLPGPWPGPFHSEGHLEAERV